jgi:hypothetical protein
MVELYLHSPILEYTDNFTFTFIVEIILLCVREMWPLTEKLRNETKW